ncbi:peptide ABC transporter [Nocardioides gansuensis]|uniref:Peptide ABC transporter n=1 Tax=Nocardioides gansuensis TaxID=2138300 RepID=A0A2T8F511_9ACTN|nr:ABC transporter permease [Nocardioides gansuensis]PVG80793.1 peptide ABC transporter [Nocardioides gansuensis]
MLKMTAARLGSAVPVLLLISVVAFTLLRLAPGDPALLSVGMEAPPEALAKARADMRLDDPMWVQYFSWLADMVRGDLGTSYSDKAPVTDAIGDRLPITVQLAVMALLFIGIVGIPLGVISALRANKLTDQLIRIASLGGISVPNFVVALFLVLIFGWWFPGIMPYQGFTPIGEDVVESLRSTLLPAVALAAPQVGLVARLTRSSMLEVLSQDYVSAARAMGVRERVIIWKDTLRNALLPVITVLGVQTGFLLGGSVVVETVFGIPGLGRLLVESFAIRDYPVTIGVMMFIAVVFVFVNIVVDLLYGVINPRIRVGYASGKE